MRNKQKPNQVPSTDTNMEQVQRRSQKNINDLVTHKQRQIEKKKYKLGTGRGGRNADDSDDDSYGDQYGDIYEFEDEGDGRTNRYQDRESQQSKEKLLEVINRMVAKNKINSKTAFDVPILSVQDFSMYDEGNRGDFAWSKMSSILENDYKIYGVRVDSIVQYVKRMSDSLGRKQVQDIQAKQKQKNKQKQKSKQQKKLDEAQKQKALKFSQIMSSQVKNNLAMHLQKNSQSIDINLRTKLMMRKDPLFQRTSRKFDHQKFSSFFMNTLSFSKGLFMQINANNQDQNKSQTDSQNKQKHSQNQMQDENMSNKKGQQEHIQQLPKRDEQQKMIDESEIAPKKFIKIKNKEISQRIDVQSVVIQKEQNMIENKQVVQGEGQNQDQELDLEEIKGAIFKNIEVEIQNPNQGQIIHQNQGQMIDQKQGQGMQSWQKQGQNRTNINITSIQAPGASQPPQTLQAPQAPQAHLAPPQPSYQSLIQPTMLRTLKPSLKIRKTMEKLTKKLQRQYNFQIFPEELRFRENYNRNRRDYMKVVNMIMAGQLKSAFQYGMGEEDEDRDVDSGDSVVEVPPQMSSRNIQTLRRDQRDQHISPKMIFDQEQQNAKKQQKVQVEFQNRQQNNQKINQDPINNENIDQKDQNNQKQNQDAHQMEQNIIEPKKNEKEDNQNQNKSIQLQNKNQNKQNQQKSYESSQSDSYSVQVERRILNTEYNQYYDIVRKQVQDQQQHKLSDLNQQDQRKNGKASKVDKTVRKINQVISVKEPRQKNTKGTRRRGLNKQIQDIIKDERIGKSVKKNIKKQEKQMFNAQHKESYKRVFKKQISKKNSQSQRTRFDFVVQRNLLQPCIHSGFQTKYLIELRPVATRQQLKKQRQRARQLNELRKAQQKSALLEMSSKNKQNQKSNQNQNSNSNNENNPKGNIVVVQGNQNQAENRVQPITTNPSVIVSQSIVNNTQVQQPLAPQTSQQPRVGQPQPIELQVQAPVQVQVPPKQQQSDCQSESSNCESSSSSDPEAQGQYMPMRRIPTITAVKQNIFNIIKAAKEIYFRDLVAEYVRNHGLLSHPTIFIALLHLSNQRHISTVQFGKKNFRILYQGISG